MPHGRPVILTDLVVSSTRWSADLVDKPGVHVATGTAEILSLVERIAAGPEEIGALFASAGRE